MDGSQTSFSFQGLTNKSSQTILNPHLLKCTALKVCFTQTFISFPFSQDFLPSWTAAEVSSWIRFTTQVVTRDLRGLDRSWWTKYTTSGPWPRGLTLRPGRSRDTSGVTRETWPPSSARQPSLTAGSPGSGTGQNKRCNLVFFVFKRVH